MNNESVKKKAVIMVIDTLQTTALPVAMPTGVAHKTDLNQASENNSSQKANAAKPNQSKNQSGAKSKKL